MVERAKCLLGHFSRSHFFYLQRLSERTSQRTVGRQEGSIGSSDLQQRMAEKIHTMYPIHHYGAGQGKHNLETSK
jgi:hypothetical protein